MKKTLIGLAAVLIAVGVFSAPSVAREPETAKVAAMVAARVKWEYMILDSKSIKGSDEDALNELGKEGWELVSVTNQGKPQAPPGDSKSLTDRGI